MFAKRHYEAIATAMQDATKQTESANCPEYVLRVVAESLANTFKADNGRFDKDRFLRACVPGNNVRARS